MKQVGTKPGWADKPPLTQDELTGFDTICWFIGFVVIWAGGLVGGAVLIWMMTLYKEMGARRRARIVRCLDRWHNRPGRGGHNARTI